MEKIIQSKLAEIEEKENIRILYAVESGSRAWGFESTDSDYDVRFLYVRPKEFYLKLENTRDVIEWQLDETLDINGWDLDKLLRLLHRSNPTVYEWANSPVVYKTSPWFEDFKKGINEYFSCRRSLCHYWSMANGNYKGYLKGDVVKLKKYFYVLRPLLACRWILDYKSPPPVLFSRLMEAELEEDIKPLVESLLVLKRDTPEIGEGDRIPKLNAYLDRSIMEIKDSISRYPGDSNRPWEPLNRIFLSAF